MRMKNMILEIGMEYESILKKEETIIKKSAQILTNS